MNLENSLHAIAAEFSPAALASSLSAEDMVITDAIARARLPISIFVLDTGRLHGDTLGLIETIRNHYGIDVAVFTPDASSVKQYVETHGRDAFYGSIDLRKRCCEMRKVEPLGRALTGLQAWITGLRRDQAVTRREVAKVDVDRAHGGILKLNPLADWSTDDVWRYVRAHKVPYNELHDQGYPSIGCAPCTRGVRPGEDLRAGRWWWETAKDRECGLHVPAAAGVPS